MPPSEAKVTGVEVHAEKIACSLCWKGSTLGSCRGGSCTHRSCQGSLNNDLPAVVDVVGTLSPELAPVEASPCWYTESTTLEAPAAWSPADLKGSNACPSWSDPE